MQRAGGPTHSYPGRAPNSFPRTSFSSQIPWGPNDLHSKATAKKTQNITSKFFLFSNQPANLDLATQASSQLQLCSGGQAEKLMHTPTHAFSTGLQREMMPSYSWWVPRAEGATQISILSENLQLRSLSLDTFQIEPEDHLRGYYGISGVLYIS